MTAESPDLVAAQQLLDAAKRGGFSSQRGAPGPDGPLWGVRETLNWRDTIYLAGFNTACTATRTRTSSLIVPNGLLVTQRVGGDALSVPRTVVCDWDPSTPAGRRSSLRSPPRELPATGRFHGVK
ncbi:MAG: hypothetical protein ACRDQ4_20330 [Pseudonocardiaceae bacterium]